MSTKIAGLSLGGGRKENFFLTLIEYFPDSERWFLRSIHQVKDEHGSDGDEAIKDWINQFELENIVVDFPLSKPACSLCELDCPGMNLCPVEEVKNVREIIKEFLETDAQKNEEDPKLYERERNLDDMVDYSDYLVSKPTDQHILSRPFKRKLKKGYLPYWNRPIDLFLWMKYYDQLLKLFSVSYDSFGNISQMLLFRFNYLKNHFPKSLNLYEANTFICLIELLKAGVITKNSVYNLNDIEMGVEARLDILGNIKKHLKVFVYDQDLEVIVKNPRAFASFLLAIGGRSFLVDKVRPLPEWPGIDDSRFLLPEFSRSLEL